MICHTISEVAKDFNIPVSTIRYYDSQGLLPFVKRNQSGVRIFDENDYEWLEIVECLKKTGLPLNKIKVYLDLTMQGDKTKDQRIKMMEHQKEVLTQQREEINQSIDIINHQCWLCKTPSSLNNEISS